MPTHSGGFTITLNNLQLYYMWMAEQLEVLDLSSNFAHDIKRLDLLSVEDLNRNLMICKLMHSSFYFPECPRPQRVSEKIVANLDLARIILVRHLRLSFA